MLVASAKCLVALATRKAQFPTLYRSPSDSRRTSDLTVLVNFHFVKPRSCPWSTQQILLSPHTDQETSAECYDLCLLDCFHLDEERPVVLHRKRSTSVESLCEKRELEVEQTSMQLTFFQRIVKCLSSCT